MNGVLQWNKLWLSHSWWNDFPPPSKSGGNIYYRIPYKLCLGGKLDVEKLQKVVERLFKKNPDFEHCDIEIGHPQNIAATNERWITAVVVTDNKEFYEKYKSVSRIGIV